MNWTFVWSDSCWCPLLTRISSTYPDEIIKKERNASGKANIDTINASTVLRSSLSKDRLREKSEIVFPKKIERRRRKRKTHHQHLSLGIKTLESEIFIFINYQFLLFSIINFNIYLFWRVFFSFFFGCLKLLRVFVLCAGRGGERNFYICLGP